MKSFSEMNQSEIDSLSDEEFNSISPFDKKSCYDCGYLKNSFEHGYLKSILNLWCTNKDAVEAKGTSIPGCIKCEYWKPDWEVISAKYKTKENGYIK